MAEETIYTALLKVQEEIRNPENTATNPFLKNKYAPLPDILNMVRPLLNKHNLILSQEAGGDDLGVYVITKLIHTSGEQLTSVPLYLHPRKNTPQEAGGAITYARRYQLTSLLGIAGEDDHDGEETPAKETTPSKPKSASPKKTPKSAKPKKQPKSAQTDTVMPSYQTLRKQCKPLDMILEEMDAAGETELNDTTIIEAGSMMVGRQDLTPGDLKVVRKALGAV